MSEGIFEWYLRRANNEGKTRSDRVRRNAGRAGLRMHFEEEARKT